MDGRQQTKIVEMTFSTRPLDDVENPADARLLGVYVDPTLTWRPHCYKTSTALSKLVYLLRNLKKCIDPSSLITIYHGVFQSKLEYALLAWGHSAHAEIVFKIQRRAVRVLAGRGYREDCRQDFRDLGILTLFSAYAYNCAIHAYDQLAQGRINTPGHTHHTRFAVGNLTVPFFRINRTKNCSYWAIRIFNQLDNNITSLPRAEFAAKTKDLFKNRALYSLQEL